LQQGILNATYAGKQQAEAEYLDEGRDLRGLVRVGGLEKLGEEGGQ